MKRFIQTTCLLLMLSLSLHAQERKEFLIEGVVYNEKDEIVSEASVYIKGRVTTGTSSNSQGVFSIKATYGDMLVFSYIGYESVEYLVTKDDSNVKIKFTESAQEVEEVMVVGIVGTQRKISSVAAITTVDVKDLQSPAPSISNLLGGRAAGVISMQNSGEPGKSIAEFWVRGIGTFGANTGALVLIDGLEGDLNSVDPADVESFSILKDASATAVYGVRGANGVVLITTKRGLAGRLQITGRVNSTLSHLSRVPNFLSAHDYAGLANEARWLRGDLPMYSDIEMEIIQDGLDPDIYPDVSWQNEILNRNSWRQSYYVSGRGGAEMARYFLSLGGTGESAAYKVDKNSVYSSNVGFNTYTYRMNLDINLTNSTSVFLGTDGFLSVLNQPGMANTDYIWRAQSQINPLALPTQYSNGMLPATGPGAGASPYVMINRTGTASDQAFKGKTTLAVNQDLSMVLDGLKFRVQGAYDIHSFFDERRHIQPPLFQSLGRNANGELIMQEMVLEQPASYNRTTSQYRKYHLETVTNYDRLFGTDHRVSALVYYYISDAKNTIQATSNMAAIPLRYQGVSSRLTYGFRDIYLLDVNFGYTGSENFQPGKQYGFFPSIAGGWVPSGYQSVQEAAPWLNFFKIRGSYGTVGNDRITNQRFPYLTRVNMNNGSPWGGSSVETISESRIGADNLAWERAIKANIGFEGRLFNNKVEFVADLFNDQRNGIFQQRVQVPDYVGVVTMPFGNVGRMRSYGADGNISYTQEFANQLGVTVRGNFTYSKTQVQNWEQAYLEYPYLENSGYPYGVIRGYQAIGLFKDQADINYSPIQTFGDVMPGDIKYKDVNGDGVINVLDKVPLSHSTFPLFMYGFGTEVRYKRMSLGVLFKGTGNTDFFHVGQSVTQSGSTYENGMGYVPFYDGPSGNVMTLAADPANRWIPLDYAIANGIDPRLAENPNARFPRLQYGMNNNNAQLSSFWRNNARYLRLQEITLNYNMSKDFLRRVGIASMDLQFVGSNLHVWDKVKLFDPEQAQFNGSVYPIPSTYSIQVFLNL